MSLLPSVRGLPRAFWVVCTGSFINRLGSFIVPFLSLYLTADRHLSAAHAGAIVSLYGAGSLAAGPVGGVLADRLGRKATMAGGLAVGAAAMLHLGAARTPLHVATATLLLGFFNNLYQPSVQALVADLVPPADRARAYGFIYWAVNLGFSVATLTAGFAASHGYGVLFVGDAATTLLFAALVVWRVPETRPVATPEEQSPRGSFTAPFQDGTFVMFTLLTFLVGVVFQQSMVGMPLEMRAHHLPPSVFGGLIAINGVLIVLLQPFATTGLARFEHSRVLAVGVLATGIGFGVMRFAGGAPVYAVSIVIWTLGEIALSGIAPAVVAGIAPPSLRGSYQGVFQMAWGASALVAPIVGGFVIDRWGGVVLWPACFVVGLVTAVGHLAIGPASRRRLALAHAKTAAASSSA